MTRSNTLRRRHVDEHGIDDEVHAVGLAMPKPPLAPATPGEHGRAVLQAITPAFSKRQSEGRSVGQPHAPAERPHPRRRLRRGRAERLRGLEDDRHRVAEADEHGDEAVVT